MSPLAIGGIGLVLLFALWTIGVPIGISMIAVGLGGIWLLTSGTSAFVTAALHPFSTIYTYEFACLPLFIIMAQAILLSGFGADLYTLARKWLGHLRGGIGIATIGACAVFAAMSASPMAATITMTTVALPEMRKSKYDLSLAAGTIAAGGTLGPLIPPSGLLIIYGIMAEESIGQLFIAGIIPGIVLALMMMASIYVRGRINPKLCPPGPSTTFKEKLLAPVGCFEVILLVCLVLGGLLIGWFTPTEAGAVGAFGAFVFALARRRMNWPKFRETLFETARTTGMLFLNIIGALLLSRFIAMTTLPMQLSNAIGGLDWPPMAIMALIIVVYLILGMFIDAGPLFFLTVPIFLPLSTSLGFNPIWFGILLVLVTNMAILTPPVGGNVWLMYGITRGAVPMETIFKGVIPFVLVMLVCCFLLLFVPELALFLPRLMG